MNELTSSWSAPSEPSEEEIRSHAYRLYQESGCVPGRDLENWLNAATYLRGRMFSPPSAVQSPGQVKSPPSAVELRAVTIGAGTLFP